MFGRQAILKATVALSTFTLVLAGPTSPLQASTLDVTTRSATFDGATRAAFNDAVPSSGVALGSGAASSQSVGVAGATATPVIPTAQGPVELAPDGLPARSGSLLVTFRPTASEHARDAANTQAHAAIAELVGRGDTVRVQVQSGTLAEAMAAYAARADVARVEPDYVLHASMTPNDPRYSDEWGLTRIQASAAWDRVGGAPDVKVAVLDTGISNHPDLAGRVVLTKDFTGSGNGTNDVVGHGTHVAGTIAAATNNGVGVAGIAFGSSLLVGKVLGDDGIGTISTVANGVVWAADNGAKVISMSLGADVACPTAMQDAVTYAWNKGVVVVAAAGNDGVARPNTPSNCTNAVPIGAVDSNDSKPGFSNYGSQVQVAAPGSMVLSTGLNGEYIWMSGTSMATPHAAGVAALIWASPYGTSNQAVVQRLFSTADRIAGTGSQWVHGRINAMAAVGGSPSSPAEPSTPTPTPATPTPMTPTPTAPTPTPSPTASPVPTSSPIASPTPPPSACDPRPNVSIRAAAGAPGELRVTIGATTTAGVTPTNRLIQVRFGEATNALVHVDSSQAMSPGNFNVTLPSGSDSYSFTVHRAAPGTAATVRLTVVDACGEWPTVVGGGPSAF